MKKRKIKKRYHKSKNVLLLVVLGITATIITALFSSFFIRINAKEKITFSEFSLPVSNSVPYGITAV